MLPNSFYWYSIIFILG